MIQNPVKPEECASYHSSPKSCRIVGPRGLNTNGVIWHCNGHGLTFPASPEGVPSYKGVEFQAPL